MPSNRSIAPNSAAMSDLSCPTSHRLQGQQEAANISEGTLPSYDEARLSNHRVVARGPHYIDLDQEASSSSESEEEDQIPYTITIDARTRIQGQGNIIGVNTATIAATAGRAAAEVLLRSPQFKRRSEASDGHSDRTEAYLNRKSVEIKLQCGLDVRGSNNTVGCPIMLHRPGHSPTCAAGTVADGAGRSACCPPVHIAKVITTATGGRGRSATGGGQKD